MKRVYLDHNATTPLHPLVVDEMQRFNSTGFGNPSSIHWFGRIARRALDRAREQVAQLLQADPSEIVFESGGTEANNHAIRGVLDLDARGRKHIITTSVEHHAVLKPCRHLETKGYHITYLPVDGFGMIDPGSVADSINEETALISVMLANNDVGTIQPVRDIATLAKERGIVMLCDAVQAVGKIPVDVNDLGVDLLSLSGHKTYGPKGIGALYVRRGTVIAPLLHGGHHEENRRAGTENVPGIVGFGRACELARQELSETENSLVLLRDRLHKGILDRIGDVRLNGHPEYRLPNTLNISFDSVDGESVLLNLDSRGIAVSTGSACTSGSLGPSHVLAAMGLSSQQALSAIRISLGRENTEEEVDTVIEALVEVVGEQRELNRFDDATIHTPSMGRSPAE